MLQRAAPAAPNGKRFHIHTFGCQMNLADSERMAGALEAQGYSCTEDASKVGGGVFMRQSAYQVGICTHFMTRKDAI